MAKKLAKKHATRTKVESIRHKNKRVNIPTEELRDFVRDEEVAPKTMLYPRDPSLDPQLVWKGKDEQDREDLAVPVVPIYIQEKIHPQAIIDALPRIEQPGDDQTNLFADFNGGPQDFSQRVDFYDHEQNWSNRFILGDSLLVMTSLAEKEGLKGKVQTIYIDPPYGIKFGSNWQVSTRKRDVKDGKAEDATRQPEQVRAFRDTWKLGIHSYLAYLRDRLVVAQDLLTETGSVFVQIGDENVHLVRCVLDEVFGSENFCAQITFRTSVPLTSTGLAGVGDYLLWYAKNHETMKYRDVFTSREVGEDTVFTSVQLPDGARRPMSPEERAEPKLLPMGSRVFGTDNLVSSGYTPTCIFPIEFDGRRFEPSSGKSWKTNQRGIEALRKTDRLSASGKTLRYLFFVDDYPVMKLSNLWVDTKGESDKSYVVQTNTKIIERCFLMTTDPGDLVLDPTCGSGTTAYVAEQWGRRWITCDTSRVAITLAKQRLMAAEFDYYELAHPEEGVGSGFRYKTIPHVTLKSVANNPEIREGMTREQIEAAIARYADQETLYDQPIPDTKRVRVTGPFTVEAVPAPTVRSLEEIEEGAAAIRVASGKTQQSMADFRDAATPLLDASVARKGATLRHTEWRDELLRTGLRGKGGHHIDFSRVEPLAGTRWLHADAETKGAKPERVVISFGPEYNLLEQRQVELAWEEARTLSPKPAILVFAAFEFDPEAAKDIDGMIKEKTGMTFLTAQMNADLLTEDLKKKRASNQSFWLVGRPDLDVRQITKGDHKGRWEVEVQGFDYYDTRTGTIESGDSSKIAMWLLDTDYDGRSLYPRQVFFPMAAEDEGWARLARNLKAEIDPDLIQAYRGTVSLPFEPGEFKRVAVKVIDDRGIESLKIVEVK